MKKFTAEVKSAEICSDDLVLEVSINGEVVETITNLQHKEKVEVQE